MLIPVQKKFTRSSTAGFSRTSKKIHFSKPPIPYRTLLIIFSVFALFYGTFLLLKYTLLVPEYTITKIDYALANVQKYDDPYLYKLISTYIKGENYRVVQRNEGKILKQIQTQYPFVSSFAVTYKGPNKVFAKVTFDEPRLVIFQGNFRYAAYPDNFFQLFSGNTLGAEALRVELFPSPDMPVSLPVLSLSGNKVTSGVNLSGHISSGTKPVLPTIIPVTTGSKQAHGALTGLFYMESYDHFISDLQLLYEAFPNAKYYKYLVGGQRMVIGLPNDRTVYINLPVDLHLQIQNYNYLKQYYPDFAKLKEIDLGSIEMDKVIVRK